MTDVGGPLALFHSNIDVGGPLALFHSDIDVGDEPLVEAVKSRSVSDVSGPWRCFSAITW